MTRFDVDVVVVGAGFAGLYSAYKARTEGWSVVGIEAAPEVGGTWFWNRYPGARCDVESLDYSYSFDEELQREWRWSERYATQPEILSYIKHVADRFDLRRHFRFETRVTQARFDDDASRWVVRTDAGQEYRARFLLLATGSLSAPKVPDIAGFEDFAGEVYMTSSWPQTDPDVSGKRVGVIGTGSSGIQVIPVLAAQAEHLTVFQRSPNFSVPAFNRELDDEEWEQALAAYPERRRTSWAGGAGSPHTSHPGDPLTMTDEERREVLEEFWQRGGVLFGKTFANQTIDPRINEFARQFAEERIREIVQDPAVADDLVPTDHPIGTKRICTDSGYFETFNRDDVTLVNLRKDPIDTITPWGIKTDQGSHELDVLVLATGFDAMTGALTRIDIEGPRGHRIADAWSGGPLTYLGMAIPGFPNMFSLSGAGSPSVLANMVLTGEQQVNWLVDLIHHCDEHGHTQVEARLDAAEAWGSHVDEVASKTLFVGANSWYMGANVEGKARGFMPYLGGFATYGALCDEARDEGYAGFVLGS
ncbi:Phenylacetone monooxygenase [Nocardioides dokdonensis FR1436]|uniref:Phenylacetone monooxygenase n=1 Tax=Nocardioides dokdonensis FR1436 TaxID=1300347 RepID=A0A1A9GFI0_9ACTN|nr:NAD(P)/FAD-dependent oxidoreductase [Nocardioides dokdonensis]ANH37089.1 Phenylacetone monooxygenase [Nocardioides dokdonensis FR1436]